MTIRHRLVLCKALNLVLGGLLWNCQHIATFDLKKTSVLCHLVWYRRDAVTVGGKKKDSVKRKVVLQWHLEFIPTWLYFKRDQETIPEHKQNVQEYRSRKIWSVFWESQVVELFWCFCGLGEEPEEKAWSVSRSIYMIVELLPFALKLCLPTNWSLGRFAVCIHFRQVLQKNTKPWF